MCAKTIILACITGVLNLALNANAAGTATATMSPNGSSSVQGSPADPASAGMPSRPSIQTGNANIMAGHDNHGYRPWQWNDFAIGAPLGVYGAYPDSSANSSNSSQQQAHVVDIAPAVAKASYAGSEVERTYKNLMLMIERARKDSQNSPDFQSALRELNDAQVAYEDAMNRVVDHLRENPVYNNLLAQRTEQDLAMEHTAAFSGLRTKVAAEKMDIGSQASLMEADALLRDSSFQDAKQRLLSAKQALWRRQADFDSSLYTKPELMAAKQSYQEALSNKAGADGYLRGAEVTRADQLDINASIFSNTSSTAYTPPYFSPYYRGYYGVGWPF